jgi:hypothetical protein
MDDQKKPPEPKKSCWDSLPKPEPKKKWWQSMLDSIGNAIGEAMDRR